MSEKTKFQQIDIIGLEGHKALMLDNFLQLWTGDEFIYHEMLAHFPLSFHSSPERVLVLGAGDGFLLRELLKYHGVKEIVLVEIDKRVVELCKEHFAEENGHSFDDPRVSVVIKDALRYADTCDKKFDVVIMDLVAFESGAGLYSEKNLKKFVSLIKDDGIFATHGDDASYPNHIGLKLYSKLSQFFPCSRIALAHIPSFDALWTFMVFSNHELFPEVTERIKTRYFDPEVDYGIPPFLQERIEHYKKHGFEKFTETKFHAKRVKLSQKLQDIIKD